MFLPACTGGSYCATCVIDTAAECVTCPAGKYLASTTCTGVFKIKYTKKRSNWINLTEFNTICILYNSNLLKYMYTYDKM